MLSLVNDHGAVPDTWETSTVLDRLISAQNAWLADHNRRRQGVRSDGAAEIGLCTLTALVLRGHAWTIAHVGDSRAWLLRGGEGSAAVQLTQDHAFDHPDQRSRLTRAIGLDDQVRIDYQQGELQQGDVFVLTSDGVHGVLSRAELARIVDATVRQPGGAQAASRRAGAGGARRREP